MGAARRSSGMWQCGNGRNQENQQRNILITLIIVKEKRIWKGWCLMAAFKAVAGGGYFQDNEGDSDTVHALL